MGIAAEDFTAMLDDPDAALAALAWQLDCGVDEAILDTPVNRHEVKPAPKAPARAAVQAQPEAPPAPESIDPVAVAQGLASAATTLEALREAVQGFDLCELKKGARNTVFADGNPKARVMILGEAPGRDEDLEGRPFVGRAGQLLDRMFQAIGLSRSSPDSESAFYISNIMFWRPPGNREPEPEEIAMTRPFVQRHVELADPDLLVVMGNAPLFALTGQRGIMRLRGQWLEAFGKPLMPMAHPAYLLRTPLAKRDAWADLLTLQARLRGTEPGQKA